MDALFEMVKSIESGDVQFPIESLYGIKVCVYIEKKSYPDGDIFYYFKISDNHYRTEDRYNYYFKSYTKIKTDEELKIMLECCVRFVKKCKIDKLTGRFVLEGVEKSQYEKNTHNFVRIINLFEDVEHIKTILNKCCVCHDWTHTTLKECQHPVCLECLIRLQIKPCEHCGGDDTHANCDNCLGLEKISTCPLCRSAILEGIY